MYIIGQKLMVYDNKYNRYEWAILKNIRHNVKSMFDNYIYPVLYDVEFVHDGRLSRGHLDFSISK